MKAEIWDLYDADGRKTGETIQRGGEIPRGRYHIGVHIWPYNEAGKFLVQRRASGVQWRPGIWAVTGGSAIKGESPEEAARRELGEELGYQAAPGELRLCARMRRTNSFCNVFLILIDWETEAFTLQQEEVSMVRRCTCDEIMRMVRVGMMYNYGDLYFETLWGVCRREGILP